jgi:dTDP-D-glucose 4,6-dehydratase
VLVTGGAGYIGSHAVKALAQAGYDVVVYDDLSAGHRAAVSAITRALPGSAITLVEGDIADRQRVTDTLRTSGASAVMHFAAKLSVAESVAAPFAYYATNVSGTLNVLASMAECNVRAFVFSSTAATFGEPLVTPDAPDGGFLIDETHPQRPINAYGESKLAVERALPHLERAHGIPVALATSSRRAPIRWMDWRRSLEKEMIPRALRRRAGTGVDVFGRLSDAGRHVRARFRARDGSRAGTHPRVATSGVWRRVGELQPWQRTRHLGARVDRIG